MQIILIISLIGVSAYGQKEPCNSSVAVDITNGEKIDGQILKNGLSYNASNYFEMNGMIYGCPCNFKTCITKCCEMGEVMKNRTCTKSNLRMKLPIHRKSDLLHHIHVENNTLNMEEYFFIQNICNRAIQLDPDIYPNTDKFFVQENGTLYTPDFEMGTPKFSERYCVDVFLDESIDGKLLALKCLPDDNPNKDIIEQVEDGIHMTGMIISMPFLLVTFIVYALLPDRNLHMKALMCYVINLLHAYIFLVTIQLTDEVIENTVCAILGFCCIFFFLSSFFWMNVICIDIFLGFRGFRGIRGVKSYERKRFLWYCLYAWGMSLVIVGITFLCNQVGNPGQWFYPGVAVGQCFLRSGIPELLYFYGPMGIIIILNVVLFTLTAFKIRQVKKDTAMLKHSESKRHSDDDQQNFNLYLKLLLAMGVNWSMELVSWAVNMNHNSVPQYIWYLSDFCNATYGVFIFFIFVFKRNIWKQLKRRYYSFMGKHHLAHSMATTNQTKTTNDSMATSVNDRIALEESELNSSRIN